MNLRWYIEERVFEEWSDRWNEVDIKVYTSKPVLQYEVGRNNWITIPTVIERIENGRREY